MAGQQFQYDDSGNTFFYFLTSFVGLIVIPATYYLWPRDQHAGERPNPGHGRLLRRGTAGPGRAGPGPPRSGRPPSPARAPGGHLEGRRPRAALAGGHLAVPGPEEVSRGRPRSAPGSAPRLLQSHRRGFVWGWPFPLPSRSVSGRMT